MGMDQWEWTNATSHQRFHKPPSGEHLQWLIDNDLRQVQLKAVRPTSAVQRLPEGMTSL